jgi:ADP-ribose pyrophosphatase YjhB (NUDIX family)
MPNQFYLPKVEFDSIYSRVPRLTVEVIVKTQKGIILTKRAVEPCIGQWHIPGGTVRFSESLHQAVKRVALEELGVQVTITKLLGYIEYPKILAGGYKGWPVGIAFEVAISSGTPHGDFQADAVEYFEHVPDNTVTEQAEFLKPLIG